MKKDLKVKRKQKEKKLKRKKTDNLKQCHNRMVTVNFKDAVHETWMGDFH